MSTSELERNSVISETTEEKCIFDATDNVFQVAYVSLEPSLEKGLPWDAIA
jgi:hypothetical protein